MPQKTGPRACAGACGLIALRRGESVIIPVGQTAEHIHFLGQVLGNGDMEYGRFSGRYVICLGRTGVYMR